MTNEFTAARKMSSPDANDVNKQIESVWSEAAGLLQEGSSEILISPELRATIGEEGISVIADRFGTMIEAQASVLLDPAANVVRILPPPGFDNSQIARLAKNIHTNASSESDLGEDEPLSSRLASNSRAKVAKERMKKIPRPPNAFILYRKHHHEDVKAKNPGIHNNEISIIIGKQWKDEDPFTRDKFNRNAAEIKRKHHDMHPTYQYQPRKASEKKRRMTKAKAERLALSATPEISVPSTPSSSLQSFDSFTEATSSVQEVSNYAHENSNFTDSASFNPPDNYHGDVPVVVPDFDVSDNGEFLFYDFETSQPGLLGAMAAKHNALHHAGSNANDLCGQPAAVGYDWTEEAADEIDFNEAMIDWQYINSTKNSAPAEESSGILNALVNESANTDGESYIERLTRFSHQFNARQDNLAVQFLGKPRSEWNKRFDSDPRGPIPAWSQPSAAPACDTQPRYNGYAPAAAAPDLPLQFSYNPAPVDQNRSPAYDLFLTSPDTTLTPAAASQSEDFSAADAAVTYDFGDVDVDFHSSFLELFNADDYSNPSIEDEYYRN